MIIISQKYRSTIGQHCSNGASSAHWKKKCELIKKSNSLTCSEVGNPWGQCRTIVLKMFDRHQEDWSRRRLIRMVIVVIGVMVMTIEGGEYKDDGQTSHNDWAVAKFFGASRNRILDRCSSDWTISGRVSSRPRSVATLASKYGLQKSSLLIDFKIDQNRGFCRIQIFEAQTLPPLLQELFIPVITISFIAQTLPEKFNQMWSKLKPPIYWCTEGYLRIQKSTSNKKLVEITSEKVGRGDFLVSPSLFVARACLSPLFNGELSNKKTNNF